MNNWSQPTIEGGWKVGLLLWVLILPCVALAEEEDDLMVLNNLKQMSLQDLGQVEIRLDKTFDVFDGLIKQQKIKVATGLTQELSVAPAVATVITAQDLEVSGARTLEEALRMVPGLHLPRLASLAPGYSFRGLYTMVNPELLIMLNNVPLKNLVTGSRGRWGVIPQVPNIARIEVIRGPGSALYGADAFAGVINIITKTVDDLEGTEAGVRVGSFDTYEGWVLHGGLLGPVKMEAAVQYRTTQGYDAVIKADGQTLRDTNLLKQQPTYQPVSLAPGPVNLAAKEIDTHLDLTYNRWQLRLDYQGLFDRGAGTFSQIVEPWGQADNTRMAVDVLWRPRISADWDLEARLVYQRWFENSELWLQPPGAIYKNGLYPEGIKEHSRLTEQEQHFSLLGLYKGFSSHLLRFGVGYLTEELSNSNYFTNQGMDGLGKPLPPGGPMVDLTDTSWVQFPEVGRQDKYVLAQDSWSLADHWELTAGVRYDRYSDFGATTNPRAALVWQLSPKFTTKWLYGRAFRAPTLNETAGKSERLIGNPQLKPETINTYEWAFDYRPFEDLYLTLNLFQYQSQDKIKSILIPGTQSFTYLNYEQWEGEGFEWEARWKMSARTSLLLNYAYANVQMIDDKKGTSIDRGIYPHHSAYLRFDWLFIPNWYFDGQAKWVAEREIDKASDPNHRSLSDYTIIDFAWRYKNSAWPWNVAVGVRNVLDEEVRELAPSPNIPYNFPLPERNWFLELRYRF